MSALNLWPSDFTCLTLTHLRRQVNRALGSGTGEFDCHCAFGRVTTTYKDGRVRTVTSAASIGDLHIVNGCIALWCLPFKMCQVVKALFWFVVQRSPRQVSPILHLSTGNTRRHHSRCHWGGASRSLIFMVCQQNVLHQKLTVLQETRGEKKVHGWGGTRQQGAKQVFPHRVWVH